jgi:hypothetical protein
MADLHRPGQTGRLRDRLDGNGSGFGDLPDRGDQADQAHAITG